MTYRLTFELVGILCLCLLTGCSKKAERPQAAVDAELPLPALPEAESGRGPVAGETAKAGVGISATAGPEETQNAALEDEARRLDEDIVRIARELTRAEEIARERDPQLDALYKEMCAKRQEYYDKLAAVSEIKELHRKNAEIEERRQRALSERARTKEENSP